jgi:hypothetical protein
MNLLTRKTIVMLIGDTGSGKDSFCRSVIAGLPEGTVERVSFGDHLRIDTEEATGLFCPHPHGSIDRDNWERATGFKLRMIETAQERLCLDPFRYVRQVHQYLETSPDRVFIVTDCRTPSELAALRDVGNVWVIKIERPNNPYPKGPLDGMLTELIPHVVALNIGNNPFNPDEAIKVLWTALWKTPY